MLRASALLSIVLPTPGTSSISRWPSASSTTSAEDTTSGLPSITRSTFVADPARPPCPASPGPRRRATASSTRLVRLHRSSLHRVARGPASSCAYVGCARATYDVAATRRSDSRRHEMVAIRHAPPSPTGLHPSSTCVRPVPTPLHRAAVRGRCRRTPVPPAVRRALRTAGPRGGEHAAKSCGRWLTVEGSGVWWSAVEEEPGERAPGERRCPMLMGTYTPRLDDKGRLFLPAKFRDQLSEGLVVTRGQERCLTVWPRPAFEQVATRPRRRRSPTGRPGLHPAAVRRRLRRPARQAGPAHHPADAPRVRRAHPRRGRDRGREPAGDLGRRPLAGRTPTRTRSRSPTSAKRSSRRRDLDRSTAAPQHAPPQQQNGSHGEVSGPLPRHLGHLPRHQTSTSHRRERAGTWPGDPSHRQHQSRSPSATRTPSMGSRP